MFAFCYDVVLNYKYVFGKNHALIILIPTSWNQNTFLIAAPIFFQKKYWLQVHASILKLKIVVSQSLQKGEECAVLFFLFCKNCILSEHLFGSIYSTKKAPLFKRSRYFFAWSQEFQKKSPKIVFKKCQKYQIIQIFQKTKEMELCGLT